MAMDYSGIPGEYAYSQTANAKSASGIIKNGAQSERNITAQKNAGGKARQSGDQGGHLIGHRFGGRNDSSNIDALAANVNQKDQANVERNIGKLAEDPNNTVVMSVSNYKSVGERPDATMINIGVRNNVTGEIDEQHISFQNANHDLQTSWSNTATQATPEIDSRQDIGMTEEQREIANELYGEENFVNDRLGSGWIYMDFDTSFLEAAPESAETFESSETGDFNASFLDGGSLDNVASEEGEDIVLSETEQQDGAADSNDNSFRDDAGLGE